MTNLKNYRVKKVDQSNGKVRYYPQKKFLWFWTDMGDSSGGSECWAQSIIFTDYHKTQKDNIEYLPADNSKTVRPEPNPPPKLV